MPVIFLVFIILFIKISFSMENQINVILDVSFMKRTISDSKFENSEIPEFLHSVNEEKNEHSHVLRENGFNLNYGEIAFTRLIGKDTVFSGTFHLAENWFEIEELYAIFKTQVADIKTGKFRSETGILNKQHDHDWYFYELPIVYFSFFGAHGINEIGIQMQRKIKSLLLGVEVLQGSNYHSFGYKNVSLYTFYAKNYAYNNKLITGLSVATGRNKSGDKVNIFIIENSVNFEKYITHLEFLYKDKGKLYGTYLSTILKLNDIFDLGFRLEYLKGNLHKQSAVLNFYKNQNTRIRIQLNNDSSRYVNSSRKNFLEFILEFTVDTNI